MSDDFKDENTSPTAAPSVDGHNISEIIPTLRAYDEGRATARAGGEIRDNPFIYETEASHYDAWLDGFGSWKIP